LTESKPSKVMLIGLISVMIFVWSVSFLFAKVALREFPGLLFAGIRTTFAAAMVLPIYWWQNGSRPRSWTIAEAPWLFILGTLGITLNQVFFVLGIARTSVAHAALVVALSPVLVLLVAAVHSEERLTARKIVGLVLAVSGVGALQTSRSSGTEATLLGDLLIFGSAIAVAFYTVYGKRYAMRHGSVTMNFFAYVGGAILICPVTLWQGARFPFASISFAGWAGLLYMALFSSIIGHLIYSYALTHLPPARLSAFSYLQPLTATVLAVLLLDERVTPSLLAGGGLIMAGVWLTERS
jgi:drug/metabolite transporter (DMT)-like permease